MTLARPKPRSASATPARDRIAHEIREMGRPARAVDLPRIVSFDQHVELPPCAPFLAPKTPIRESIEAMAAGTSFFLVAANQTGRIQAILGRLAHHVAEQHPGRAFATRRLTEKGHRGVRIWRTA